MKKSMSILFLCLCLCLCLIGCAGASDYDIDLPGNYSIVRLSAEEIILAPKVKDGLWGETIIPTKIIEAGWNNDVIVCKQENVNTKEINYWIINIHDGETIGPIDHQKFEEELKAKRVTDIKLEKVELLKN